MKVIPPYQTTVTLFGLDGTVLHFKSLKRALKALGFNWICEKVAREFCLFKGCCAVGADSPLLPTYVGSAFIMRDDNGLPLTADDFKELVQERKKLSRWRARQKLLENWYGKGPVPFVHKRSAGQHTYRRIRHANARRQAVEVAEEGEIAPRARRNLKNLPNNWDDYLVAAREIRSWKRFRKHQWKCPSKK